MDLHTVETVHAPTRRDAVFPLGPADAVLAGGTWLFSEPQPHLVRLVDITALGWEPITMSDAGIELAATCTIAEVAALSTTLPDTHPEWAAAPLFRRCATALVAAQKIWRTATVGGNICLSLPAGSMISLSSSLDATLTVWRGADESYTSSVEGFVTGFTSNILQTGDVLRSIQLPAAALRAHTAVRSLAQSPLGRSGVVVIGRRDLPADGGAYTLSVTAATLRPLVFRFPAVPDSDTLRTTLTEIPESAWNDDLHGDPDWRAAMTMLLAEQVRDELA
ncbi:FAD binding domain-containing protein [Mycolicibacterium iranicum]|uniref:FAD-binding molybdopterin dehydrogenase n=1 Tax=Mycolicibacterium iranicum TaxID=912594 RepID=A0A178M5C2_MYCIR|nr:FAD binding domain-containing protein [Mycolicibacterium iranicum]OAN42554.1 FAD-binding molybdopterin dehydrogenase [Mycolicibacterium iranicum]